VGSLISRDFATENSPGKFIPGNHSAAKLNLKSLLLFGKSVRGGLSLDFADLHAGVDGEIGIAYGRTSGSGEMAGRGGEIAAVAFDGIGIAVAFGAGHGNGIGGDEFGEGNAVAVGGDVAMFRVSNLQKIGSNTCQADGLGGSRAAVRGRHTLKIKVIHHEDKSDTDQEASKTSKKAHEGIVAPRALHFKWYARGVA
jgi:hypothetical protein